MTRWTSRWLCGALLLGATFTTRSGSAQVCGTAPDPACCVLGPVALPGLSGPPEWQDFNGDGFWRPELHDPRWSGATFDLLTYLPSTGLPAWTDDMAMRVLAQGTFLYVSFQAQFDDVAPNGDDYVYLAMSKGGANGAIAIKIPLLTGGAAIGAPPDPDGGGPVVVPADSPLPTQVVGLSWFDTTDATVPTPTWSGENTSALTWLQGARWDRPVLGSPRWGVTLRMDLGPSGFNISAGNIRLFFGAKINQSTGDVIVGNRTPKIDADVDKVGDTVIPHRSAQWADYLAPASACPGAVTVSASDVGVWTGAAGSPSPGSLTNEICAAGACGTGNNVFRVTAHNVPNTLLSTWGLRARMRIADWGSTVAYWNHGRWKDFTVTPAGTNVFTAPGAAFTTGNGWYTFTAADGVGTSAVTIDYLCDRGSNAYCPLLEDPSYFHQCMLVELGQPAPTLQFQRKAVFRNMNFADLSTLDAPAKISIEGLKAVLGEAKDRDVFLYVEGKNLPPHGDKPLWLPAKDMAQARQFAEHPISVPQEPRRVLGKPQLPGKPAQPKDAKGVAVPPPAQAPVKLSAQQELAGRIANSPAKFSNGLPVSNVLAMGSDQLLDAVWPTYRIRVYYDSGKTFTTKGVKRPVLVPMVPFGYRLNHDGPFFGITHQIQGSGVELVPAGGNWFKVRIVSEGSVKVKTKISAEERPKSGGPGPCPTCTDCPDCKVGHGGHCHCRMVQAGSPRDLALGLGGLFVLAVGAAVRRRRRRRPD